MDQLPALHDGPRAWSDASADELVLLMPALARAPVSVHDGPAMFLRRALLARIMEFAAGPAHAEFGMDGRLDLVFRNDVVTALSPRELLLEGDVAWQELYGTWTAEPLRLGTRQPSRAPEETDKLKVFELSILAVLDRLLRDSLDGAAHARTPMPLPSALVGSIYTSVNAAYLYPHLACMHELMTVGAWLGYLVRRRDAFLPVPIAERLVDHLAHAAASDGSEAGMCESLIRLHADLAGGCDRLLDLARQAVRRGRPLLARPRRTGYPADFEPMTWNAGLTVQAEG